MKQVNTVALIIVLVVLVVIIILLQLMRGGSSQPVDQQPIDSVRLIKTNITNRPLRVIEPIEIKFSQPINLNRLAIQLDPPSDIATIFDIPTSTLTIKPRGAWRFGTTYQLTVLRATKSVTDQPLDQDYQLTFTTEAYGGL